MVLKTKIPMLTVLPYKKFLRKFSYRSPEKNIFLVYIFGAVEWSLLNRNAVYLQLHSYKFKYVFSTREL